MSPDYILFNFESSQTEKSNRELTERVHITKDATVSQSDIMTEIKIIDKRIYQ